MASALIYRGPDDGGVWSDGEAGVALAHRRLAIIDLSAAGHQPMCSPCGRFVVVFNGEIYNHHDIRRNLDSTGDSVFSGRWRGHSDTETLLAAIAAWGIEATLVRLNGMFAFAVWDRHDRTLYLARDRFGEKPLYYGMHQGGLLFASELKALKAFPAFRGEIDRDALAAYLCRNALPSPRSIYRGIGKLTPGTWLKVAAEEIESGRLSSPTSYWSLTDIALSGQQTGFAGGPEEAVDALDGLLRQSVKQQMLADVPLGAFLSGGIDSSTVVALMQSQSPRPVKTFTIGFHEAAYDEAAHARAVAAHLGTEHTDLIVEPRQVLDVIPRLPQLYDEPFADVSQIPTFLVCELARRHVTVCLSGDGGDELFGGYNRHVSGARIWRRFGWMPQSARSALGSMLTMVPPGIWDSGFERLGTVLPKVWRQRTPGDKLHKLGQMLSVGEGSEIYDALVSQWRANEQPVIGGSVPPEAFSVGTDVSRLRGLEHQMMCLDGLSYLPDSILVKVDRAAMAVSLETRVPMLDHNIVAFAWSLPLKMKIRGNEGKWVLRQLLDRYVPRSLIERPKAGFGVPIDAWLRGPLKEWAEDLLSPDTLQRQGYLRVAPIRARWEEHVSGRRNWSTQLWGILMFQAWVAHAD